MTLRVVHARVDAWVFAFRVLHHDALREILVQAAITKAERGHCEVEWGPLRGALSYAGEGKWLVANARYRVLLLKKGPGARELRDGTSEVGWTVEVVWYAQGAADLRPSEVYAESRALALGLGEVFGARLRRIDLAADVAGYDLRDDDAENFCRRPRARLSEFAFAPDAGARANAEGAALETGKVAPDERADRTVVRHWLSKITGFTVCPGGRLMARIYDKRAHLQLLQEPVRQAEEARWREGGWEGGDDDPVTRVEFQLRGDVLAEFGVRDPEAVHDPRTGEVLTLEEAIARIWRTCLAWLSLRAVDAEEERLTRRALDARWHVLYSANFGVRTTEEHGRLRVRGGASIEQKMGCELSILASRDMLERFTGNDLPLDEDEAAQLLRTRLDELSDRVNVIAIDHMVKRWGGAVGACTQLATVVNAKRARFFDPLAVATRRRTPALERRDFWRPPGEAVPEDRRERWARAPMTARAVELAAQAERRATLAREAAVA